MKAIMIRTAVALVALLAVWGFYNIDFSNDEIDLDNEYVYFQREPVIALHVDKDCPKMNSAFFWTYRELFTNNYSFEHLPLCTHCVTEKGIMKLKAARDKFSNSSGKGRGY